MIAGILMLAGAACVVWGIASYVGLLHLEVRVADASDRVEAAGRSRAQLTANLIHASAAFDCLSSADLAELRAAADRANGISLAPEILAEPESYLEFLAAQAELSGALDGIWSVLQSDGGIGSQALVDDLRGNLADAESALLEQIAELDRRVEAYRSRSGGFPRSVIAAMAAGRGDRASRPRSSSLPTGPPAPAEPG
jgi:hypothetical protein